MKRLLGLFLLCVSCATPGSSLSAHRDRYPLTVDLEAGGLWQTRNDVRIPSEGGDRFSLSDLAGEGPAPIGRVTADWDVDGRHAVRFVVAPLSIDGEGRLSDPTTFAGGTFAPGVTTDATYEFNSYRLGYRYTFLHDERWRLRAGGTLFVRDAKIELSQPGVQAQDSDVGLVPLLNFAAEYYPAERWSVVSELDGLAASQGRAVDFSLKARYDVTERCSVSLGYRTIEGGADNDEVFNFAWLHSVFASVQVRF